MSSSSYAAWAKFDVEKELERVDEAARREDQERQQLKQTRAKESVETEAVEAAQQSAEVLAARAAVAAIKAKKKTQRGRKLANKDQNSVAKAADEEEKAKRLQNEAVLASTKQKLLQQIMKNRRLGDAIIRAKEGQKDWKTAKSCFDLALIATKKLEELSPELLKAEEQKENEATAENQLDTKRGGCRQEREGHSCGDGCSHDDKKTRKAGETLPKANDLVAIIKMFYKDVYLGIGMCEFEEGRLAAAAEAFKEVLVRDEVHLVGWIKRGEAFERMNAPLLAMLHFNRVVSLDSDHEIGKKALERVKTMLLTEGDALSDKSSIKCAVSTYIGGPTLRGILERIQWVFEEANVLAVENFYDYSTTKYQVVLGCLEELRARPELFISDEKAISVVLRELEISCHLNIASGCLEMQRNYMKGLNHCDQVLNLDSSHAVCHFRKGQLYQALHNYDKALASLGTAKSLLSGVEGEQRSDEQQKSMLATVDKEIDKCNFARHQYDIKYLRSLATAQTTK